MGILVKLIRKDQLNELRRPESFNPRASWMGSPLQAGRMPWMSFPGTAPMTFRTPTGFTPQYSPVMPYYGGGELAPSTGGGGGGAPGGGRPPAGGNVVTPGPGARPYGGNTGTPYTGVTPGGPGFGQQQQPVSMGGNTFAQKAPAIMHNLMRDFNLKDFQAAAIVGNLGHESGGFKYFQEIAPVVPGSRGGAGWAQWTGPRRRAFEAYAKQNNLDIRSDAANYGFLKHEISTQYGGALAGLKRTTNAEDAMTHWEGKYEGSTLKNYPSRMEYTNLALDLHKNYQPPANDNSPQTTQIASNDNRPQNSDKPDLSRYASGNARPGGASTVEGLHPEFARRIQTMVNAMPPEIAQKFEIISGFRSQQRQQQVNPGVTNSHHTQGMAVDTTWDPQVRSWIGQNGPKFGLGYPLAHDPKEGNHMEPLEDGERVHPTEMAQWREQYNTPPPTQTASTQQSRPTQVASLNPSQPLPSGPQQQPIAIGDSIAYGVQKYNGLDGDTLGGRGPRAVLASVQAQLAKDPNYFKDKPVIFSSGKSNDPRNPDMSVVDQTLNLIKSSGAGPIHVLGVGPHPNYNGYNDLLAKSAATAGATFHGPLPGVSSSEGIHPSPQGYKQIYSNVVNTPPPSTPPPSNVASATPPTSSTPPQQQASATPPKTSPPPQQQASVTPPDTTPTPPTQTASDTSSPSAMSKLASLATSSAEKTSGSSGSGSDAPVKTDKKEPVVAGFRPFLSPGHRSLNEIERRAAIGLLRPYK